MLMAGLLISCAAAKKAPRLPGTQKIEFQANTGDSTEYELIIIDPGFESWFVTNRKPERYYTNDYLATMNYQYVIAWNAKVRDPISQGPRADNPYIMEIDYRPAIDYGIKLNYKLYHYFKYVEKTWGRILPYERHI